jgi:hypothetical protein
MQRLHVELSLLLQLAERHGRTRRRLGFSLLVTIVVLLRLDVRSIFLDKNLGAFGMVAA